MLCFGSWRVSNYWGEVLCGHLSTVGVEPMDVPHKFRSVEQRGDMDVEQYLERLEEAMSAMVSAYPGLQETFYVSCFISGLKPDIKLIVVMHSPTTLTDAFQVAKLQEN